ncbi:MAG: hypothetical protein ACK4MF_07505, partial [Hyphomicrobiaceae bacterium]
MIGVRFVAAGSMVGAVLGAVSGATSGDASVTELIGGSAIPDIVAVASVAHAPMHDDRWTIATVARADDAPSGARREADATSGRPGFAGPSIARIDIAVDGSVRFAGFGTPGERVTLRTADAALGSTVVSDTGEWRLDLARALGAGVHRIEAQAGGGDAPAIPGSDVRIAIPADFGRGPVVAFERDGGDVARERAAREAERRERAERLAEAASQRFSELTRGAEQRAGEQRTAERPDRVADATGERAPAASRSEPATDLGTAVSERLDGALIWLQEWLARANREYQREVVRRLQVPAPAPDESG